MTQNMKTFALTVLLTVCLSIIVSADIELNKASHASKVDETQRKAKFFPIFQVVTFPNKGCTGSSTRNGTCYTTAECTAKGGSTSGSCAQGYGVCCIFTLSCGGNSSQNCTYLVQASTTKSPGTTCTYTLCKCNSNICRIRLDFTTFQIAGPQAGTTTPAATAATNVNGGAVGDCVTDSFSLSSPGNVGSPVICGFNTGQHMIVDASDTCSVANFDIGSTSDTRQWDIKVTQYACGDDQGGPEGCLQYFTGTSGKISSFNFPTAATSVGATTTHLSSQCYTMCFRQELGKCSICFVTAITPGPAIAVIASSQASFGLSVSPATTVSGATDSNCISDYLQILGAEGSPATGAAGGTERICGRIFSSIAADTNFGVTVCTKTKPFKVTFKTDANEVTTSIAATMSNTNEQNTAPGGITGFSLNYMEVAC